MTATTRNILLAAALLCGGVATAAPPDVATLPTPPQSGGARYEHSPIRPVSYASSSVDMSGVVRLDAEGPEPEPQPELQPEPVRPQLLQTGAPAVLFSQPRDDLPEPPAESRIPSVTEDGRLILFSAPKAPPAQPDPPPPPGVPPAPGGPPGDQKIGEAPEKTTAYIQFLRRDSILLKPGEYQLDISPRYMLDEADFTLAQTINNTLIIGEARRRRRLLLIPVELRFGVVEDVQAFVNVPFGWAHNEFDFGPGDQFDSDSGLGDVSAGLTRLIYKGEGPAGPQVLTSMAFSAPTANASVATSLSSPGSTLGLGFWTLSADLTFIHTYDPLVIYYGAGYRARFENTIDGFDVSPGDQFFYRFGLGFAVNPKVTLSAMFMGSFIGESKINDVSIPGSILEPLQVRLAATIVLGKAIRECPTTLVRTIEPSVTFGITEDAIDSIIGVSYTY